MSLRICFVAGTLGRGGAERQLLYMVRALHGADVTMRVLSLTRGEVYEEELRALGVRVDYVGASKSRAARALAIARNLRREPADIVQCVQMFVNLYGVAGARACGAVALGAVRTDPTRNLRGTWWLLGRASLRLPDYLLVNSHAAARGSLPHVTRAERVIVLPNVVDTERFYPAAHPEPRSRPRVLFLGRLYREKRPDRFVRAAAAFLRRHPEAADFWIVGDGPMRPELEAEARALGIPAERLTFWGQHDDPSALLRTVDLVVLTSDTEGQPNALIEAMASGVPVLATNVGGVAEVVPPEAGVLVSPHDEERLADELVQLVLDGERRQQLGARGVAQIGRERSLTSLRERLLEIYAALRLRPDDGVSRSE